MNSILIITSLLIIFSIFSHALIKLGIGVLDPRYSDSRCILS
ncbi:hypothetical protein FSI34_015915 [Escherichia coli]|nr:hypothetical protein [Escherichia coli]